MHGDIEGYGIELWCQYAGDLQTINHYKGNVYIE